MPASPASRRAWSRAAAAFAGRKVHWTFRFSGSPLELVVEARDTEHAQEIRDLLTAKGYRQI